MGLVHTPRVLAAIARGLARGKKQAGATRLPGLSLQDPHVYRARVGLFDVDYLGHMNNAAYMNHAEYARWQWSAELGFLGAFLREKNEFIVSSAAVRYRREIKPLFRQFEIHTSLCGVDDRALSIYQTFRYPGQQGGVNKIRAQVMLQAVIRKGRNVVDPRDFLKNTMHMESDVIDAVAATMQDDLLKYEKLEDSLREMAAEDDKCVHPS